MKKYTLLFAMMLFAVMPILQAQTGQITGKVTSAEDGSPVPGVSVVVKGTTMGTTTDSDGSYSLNVPDNATTIVFSFVGLKSQEVAIGGRSTIDIVMEQDVVGLEEVVVTALGITRSKKALGYSVSEFNSEDMERSQVIDATRALQGRVAGVNISSSSGAPGASTSIFVRGLASITQSNQPLYVVDGVPVNNQFNSGNSTQATTNANLTVDFGNAASDINPADIETMSILKGAAATSLYGSRAANGAVIITTKSGKLKQNLRVDINSSATFSEVGRLPYYQKKYGQGWNGVYNSQENGSWGPVLDGKERLTGNVVDNSQRIAPFKFQKNGVRDFYERGYAYNNSIAISGGGEKIAYYASYANTTQDGIIPTDADILNRNSITLKANGGSDKTRIGFSASFTNKKISAVSTGQSEDAGGGKAVFQEIMQNPVNHYIPLYRDYNNKFDNLDNFYTAYGQNPYFIVNENGNDFEQNRLITSLDFSRQLFDNFKIIWRGGLDHYSNFYKRYGAIATITPGSPNSTANDVAGLTQEEGRTVSQLNSDLLLNFTKNLELAGRDFSVDITLGNNLNQFTTDRLTTIAKGLVVPKYYNVQNIRGSAEVSSFESKRRTVGLFGTVNLNYTDLLYLQLSGRNDWSSTLPKENNSFFYPGVNLSFVFSELLPSNNPVLSFGKLRIGYALAGNDAPVYSIDPFYRAAIIRNGGYGFTVYPVSGQPAFEKYRRLGNPNLKSELSKEFEVGTDLRFLNNRIGVDLSYYNKVTTDLIFDATIAGSSGYDLQTTNLGQITNSGVELKLDLVPLKTESFSWNLSYIFTKSNTVLDKLAPELGVVEYIINSAYETEFVAIPGKKLGQFRIPDYQYTPDGKIVVGDNGLPLEGDKRLYATSVPDYRMSLINTISFKGLSLSFLIDYQEGGSMYSNTANSAFWGGNGEQTLTNDRRPWVIPNSVQRVVNDDGTETFVENSTPVHNNWHEYYSSNTNKPIESNRIVDKTYIKLREVSLNYNFPAAFFSKLKISALSIGIFGNNLFLWTPASNSFIDPETTTFGNDIESLFGEFDGAPSIRSVGAKLNVSF